jgi:outer membrane lipoprotein-sorting protein
MKLKWIVGVIIFCSVFFAIAWSEPSKQSIEYKMKNVKNYNATYHSTRRMDVN